MNESNNGQQQDNQTEGPGFTVDTGLKGTGVSELDGKAPTDVDFTNYFITYGYLYHQKEMIEDRIRTGKYYEAIVGNSEQFKDKVVLDVGTGSGILAIFAAKAGARKVYAVEATGMAKYAKQLVEQNKLDHVVTVIQGLMETISLPEQVDIIISEWMGYMLLRESMLDCVITARNRFMKPGGSLYPSHAKLLFQPMYTPLHSQKKDEFGRTLAEWHDFVGQCNAEYGVDFGGLSTVFQKEYSDYLYCSCHYRQVELAECLGPAVCFKEFDLNTCTLEEIQAPVNSSITLPLLTPPSTTTHPLTHNIIDGVNALCGFFDVDFRGSKENPAKNPVVLSTSPSPQGVGGTHWAQQVLLLDQMIRYSKGESLTVDVEFKRKQDYGRHMLIKCSTKYQGTTYPNQPACNRLYDLA